MVDPDELVGVAEIASGARVSKTAVTNWRRRHESFPVPVVTLACGPLWRWPDIEAWLTVRRAVSTNEETQP